MTEESRVESLENEVNSERRVSVALFALDKKMMLDSKILEFALRRRSCWKPWLCDI